MKKSNEFPAIRNATENVALLLFLLVLLLVSGLQRALAQAPSDEVVVEIETHDGNKYTGRLLEENDLHVVIVTQSLGKLVFPRSAIKHMDRLEASKIRNDGYWSDNLQATRNFWAPTGYGLKAGEAYYQNVWVLFNQFSVGITRHVSLGVGFVPMFLFAGASSPMWLMPKISIPLSKDKINVGVGAVIGTTSLTEKGNGFGIIYGSATFGSRDNNVTFGMGYGYSSGSTAKRPVFNLSALIRTSAKSYFISENYVIPIGNSSLILVGLGARKMANRTGIDFGFFLPFDKSMRTIVAIPWLGITAPLGGRKY
jgi:hypothetical protein